MSKNSPSGIDRRSKRTRLSLANALMALGSKRDVDAVEVGQLADEAGIGRSTFYAHYASKSDFIAASFAEMIAGCEAREAKIDPSRADLMPALHLLLHICEARDFALSIFKSEEAPRIAATGEAKLRSIAETNLAQVKPTWSQEQRRETAVFVAAGFMGLLRWQVENGLKQSPHHMHAAYRQIVQRALSGD